jgi:hypothetical protein
MVKFPKKKTCCLHLQDDRIHLAGCCSDTEQIVLYSRQCFFAFIRYRAKSVVSLNMEALRFSETSENVTTTWCKSPKELPSQAALCDDVSCWLDMHEKAQLGLLEYTVYYLGLM